MRQRVVPATGRTRISHVHYKPLYAVVPSSIEIANRRTRSVWMKSWTFCSVRSNDASGRIQRIDHPHWARVLSSTFRPQQGLLPVQTLRDGRFLTDIDKPWNRSYAGFMNLQVPPELEAKLTRLAAETGRTADQVALDLLASSVDHDEWFRAEIEKGRAAAREGRLIEHDDVAARMDRRYRG
jgi:predicted transcriptional regulator